MTDIDDFLKKVQPRGKRSKLNPFADEIFLLKEQHYTLDQICTYLFEKKSLEVSRQNLHLWINKNKTYWESKAAEKKLQVQPQKTDKPKSLEEINSVQKERENKFAEVIKSIDEVPKETLAEKLIRAKNT